MNPTQIRQHLDELLQQSPFASLSADAKLLAQSQLQAFINKANLVGREEFDIQQQALARTEAKLAQLESKLSELEGLLSTNAK